MLTESSSYRLDKPQCERFPQRDLFEHFGHFKMPSSDDALVVNFLYVIPNLQNENSSVNDLRQRQTMMGG